MSLKESRAAPAEAASTGAAGKPRTRTLTLPEARSAAASLTLFWLAVALRVAGTPAWAWAPLFAACYVFGGCEPARAGLEALREKRLDVDLLMIVAALGAAAIGQVVDGALLIVIFATSRALEAMSTARTEDSVRGLLDVAPATATRLLPNLDEERVATTDLEVGDTVLVRPGERIGADGRVIDGVSEVDQATITGEPLPVPKRAGDEVFAGTLNGTGALRVQVERDPNDSVIARIVAMVEEASDTKAPTQLLIEKVEQRYSFGVVIATLAVFAVPLASCEPLSGTLLRAMTFMIVASPCALVLATMPPLLSAIANAGRHGVLIKSAVALERLAQVDVVALDKTGTLTEGTPRVTDVRPLDGSGLDAGALLALAAAAERPSGHPLARAVVEAARSRGIDLRPAEDFACVPGEGVTAIVDGSRIVVRRPSDLPAGPAATAAVLAAAAAARDVAGIEEAGGTAVVVLRDGLAVGILGIADRLRPDAVPTVAALAALTDAPPVLMTGDNRRAAGLLGSEVGIADIHAALLPEDKVEIVLGMGQRGLKVLAIGDGVNDAPALAAAHASIAMGGVGSDVARETADVIIVRDELAAVPAAVELARRARRLVVQNLILASAAITGLVAWDLVGHLPLPLGVAGHEGSTVLVALNGLRVLRHSAWNPASRPNREG